MCDLSLSNSLFQLDLIGQNEIIGLDALPDLGGQMLAGNISGRYVVDPSL